MIYEEIDLYEYFSVPRNGADGGILTAYVASGNGEIPARVRPAMLVIPGGAYCIVSAREGEPVAVRFMSKGYGAFRLRYTVNSAYPVPLIEAAMAMVYIRENAEKYSLDGEHVAAIGFSAGGHLTGMLGTLFGDEAIVRALGARRAELVRPDAVVLSYPVVTLGEYAHETSARVISGGDETLKKRLSVENCVTEQSSPAFLWHTVGDGSVPVANSLILANAYLAKGVPFEAHLFEKGNHGLSLANEETEATSEGIQAKAHVRPWVDLALTWLKGRGFEVKY